MSLRRSCESFLRDLVYAFRALRKSPGFTAVAIAILAIGIGVNAAVFTVAKAALFAGFPQVAHNDRILYLSNSRGCCVSYPDFLDWRAQARSFQGMAIVHGVSGILSDNAGFPESYDATEISADTFRVVGRKPLLGRDFVPADQAPGAPAVAILSYGFWERRFARDPSIIGHRVRLNGVPASVVGVMPRGFSFPQKQDLWIPMVQTPELLANRQNRSQWFAFGRMADGVTVQMARAEMEMIGRRLGAAYPRTNQGRNLLPQAQTFNEFFIFDNETAIYWSLWGAVAFVLSIACANLANLTFARTMERSRQISVRIALGAGRWRILRQLLAESVIITGAGSLLGLFIAQWGLRAYAAADRGPGRSSWRILDYSTDYRVLAYLVAIGAGTALILALAPMRRLCSLDIGAALKDGDHGAAGGRRASRLSALLVTAEIALAVLLLTGAGVMTRSFLNLYTAPLGVKTANILTLSVNSRHSDSFFDRARPAFQAIPGVASIAIASNIPTSGAEKNIAEIPGDASGDQSRPTVFTLAIGPGYFRTLGTTLSSGRDFNESDGPSTIPVAIINERMARQYWPGENPLGKHLRLAASQPAGPWLTVIGIAPNIAQNGLFRRNRDSLLYLPFRQKPRPSMTILARTLVPPETSGGRLPQGSTGARRASVRVRSGHARRKAAIELLDERALRSSLRHLRRLGAAHRFGRIIRRYRSIGCAPHARDRHSHGDRRVAQRYPNVDPSPGNAPCWNRPSDRRHRLSRSEPRSHVRSGSGLPRRPGRARRRLRTARSHGRARLSHPRPPRRADRSNERHPPRIICSGISSATIIKTPNPGGSCCWILQSWPWKTEQSSRAGVLVRLPNAQAKSFSILPSPVTRKFSPTPPIPARSSSSPTPRSEITGPAPVITKRPNPV